MQLVYSATTEALQMAWQWGTGWNCWKASACTEFSMESSHMARVPGSACMAGLQPSAGADLHC